MAYEGFTGLETQQARLIQWQLLHWLSSTNKDWFGNECGV